MNDAEAVFANPGAIHADGVAAKRALEGARSRIAKHFGVKARHLIFTSGLTEANNLAVLGAARRLAIGGTDLSQTHWIVSSIEHDSVLACLGEVERLGGTVTFVDPDEKGLIHPDVVRRAMRPETIFVSVGWANNELGTLQPLGRIARLLREHETKFKTRVLFHADAGQAPLYLPTVISSLGVDLLALGAGKLYGPRSAGALYVSEHERLAPILLGGKQEMGLRAGTEEVVPAVGFAAALDVVVGEREREAKRLSKLRDELAAQLTARIPGLIVNGDLRHALPHMLNVSIPNIQSEYVTLALDHEGIAVSTKSACREGEESMSHVVLALGDAKGAGSSVGLAKEERSKNTIRLSLGRDTRDQDIRVVAATFARLVRAAQ